MLYRGGSEQRKVTPRNNGKLQTFIACFWSHNWIDKASAGKLLHNPVAPQNNFKNAQTILSNYAMPQAVSLSKPHCKTLTEKLFLALTDFRMVQMRTYLRNKYLDQQARPDAMSQHLQNYACPERNYIM